MTHDNLMALHSSGFMPHGFCYLRTPWLLSTNVIAAALGKAPHSSWRSRFGPCMSVRYRTSTRATRSPSMRKTHAIWCASFWRSAAPAYARPHKPAKVSSRLHNRRRRSSCAVDQGRFRQSPGQTGGTGRAARDECQPRWALRSLNRGFADWPATALPLIVVACN